MHEITRNTNGHLTYTPFAARHMVNIHSDLLETRRFNACIAGDAETADAFNTVNRLLVLNILQSI